MIVPNNHQQNLLYFKQYPCYSMTTHLSQHRELEFAHVTMVRFSNKTAPKCDLPKFYIDKYQVPQQMYWLEWRMEDVPMSVIEQGVARVNCLNSNKSEPHSPFTQSKLSTQSLRKLHCRCLYIAQVGKAAHIKLVFNSDPEIVAICQDYLYTIGGSQLIITELWPQTTIINNMESIEEIPPRQLQIVHRLDQQSRVLGVDFVCDEEENVVCKVVYFNDKKGIYSQTYTKDKPSQGSLLGKLIDFSLKFKKSQPSPLHYQTLVPNILAIAIYNTREFILFDLTEMKPLPHTKSTLQGWELNHHQPIVIKTRENTVHQGYNDCLLIGIGQGAHIEIFLFHLKYSSTATLVLPRDNNSKLASDLEQWPIHMFSSGEFIDFQHSIIKHWTVIHLQKINKLSSFILSKDGLVYLGYDEGDIGSAEQMPHAGFVDYEKPYVTHEILMLEDRVWREYKVDVLMGLGQEHKGDRTQECLQRLLTPGRYQTQFILSTLNLPSITSLPSLLHHPTTSFKQINQKLLYTWRNDYKFIDFAIYHQQFLIIRKSSISTLIEITSQEYRSSKDKNAEIEVACDRLGFNGIEMEDEGEISYEERMRVLGGRIKDVMSEQYHHRGNQLQQHIPIGGYYDEQEFKKYSQLYKQALQTITHLAARPTLTQLPQRSFTQQQFAQQPYTAPFITNNKHILLHASTLSLRVKDQLRNYIDTLRTNYQYFVENLGRERREGDVLEKVHLRHAYTVYILQWVNNIATKCHLQTQLALFSTDLISQFINHYITNYCKGSYIEQNGTVLTTQNKLYKTDLDIHVNNVFSLLLRGLLKEIDFTMWDGNIVDQAREVGEMSEEEIVSDRVGKINAQANPLIMMLLKKHTEIAHQSKQFITHSILTTLFQPLLLNPTNQSLSLLLPINKTFVYSILSLPITRQQKLRLLSSHMHRPEYLAMLLLMQLENNCYLMMDEGMEVEIYGNNVGVFVGNTVRLNREQCCLLQELILTNYNLFLFPTKSHSLRINQQQHSHLADPQLHLHQQTLNQSKSIEFIKLLFSNIDFMHLTSMITRPMKQKTMYYGDERQLKESLEGMIENDKGLVYVYRQLMLQVERINESYGFVKATPIQRTFKRFFTKIYHPKPKHQGSTSQQSYPQLTGLDYHLNLQQLDVIDRLYAKHLKLLKMDKKQSFESTSIIQQVIICMIYQQRLNLQYTMLRIFMFRLNLALKEISLLTQSDKLVYVEIMRRCVEALREAVKCFKHWRLKLEGRTGEEKVEISDEQFLSIVVEIDNMQASVVWNDSLNQTQQTLPPAGIQVSDWLILDIPLSSQWLQLLLLTFNNQPPSSLTTIKPADMIFTNYQEQESILMKMLIVIKRQKLVREYESLVRIFGRQKVEEVVKGNEMLRKMYAKGLKSDMQEDAFASGHYVNTGSRGLLSYTSN